MSGVPEPKHNILKNEQHYFPRFPSRRHATLRTKSSDIHGVWDSHSLDSVAPSLFSFASSSCCEAAEDHILETFSRLQLTATGVQSPDSSTRTMLTSAVRCCTLAVHTGPARELMPDAVHEMHSRVSVCLHFSRSPVEVIVARGLCRTCSKALLFDLAPGPGFSHLCSTVEVFLSYVRLVHSKSWKSLLYYV